MKLINIIARFSTFLKDNYRLLFSLYVIPCVIADLVVYAFLIISFKFKVPDIVLLLSTPIIYYFSFNVMATFQKFKTLKGKLKLFYTAYDEQDFNLIYLNDQTEDNHKEYYSHVYSSMTALVILYAGLSYLINNFALSFSNITCIIVINVFAFLLRVIVFILCKIPRKLFNSITLAVIIILFILGTLICMFINDINNRQTFLSMSIIFWVSSRMIPTFLDNLSIQNDYLNNKITIQSIEYKARTSFLTVVTYTIVFMLNIATLKLTEGLTTNNDLDIIELAKGYIIYFLGGLYISILLIILCSLIFAKNKSLYSEENPTIIEDATISNSETGKKYTIFMFNALSIIICTSFLVMTEFIFKGNQEASLDIIKLYLPVFVVKLLEGLPHFYNFMHLGTKQQILPTLKFDYLKQMLEVNTI